MTTAITVRLDSTLRRQEAADVASCPVLAPEGPMAILGGAPGGDGLAIPVQPATDTLFGPRGACMLSGTGPLWVCDTGHHRLLGWRDVPAADGTPADWLIGQPEFTAEGRNGKRSADAASLNVPTGIAACGDGLAVADAWNHRVLIWHRAPTASHRPADIVLGQGATTTVEANRGAAAPTAASLFWPYGVYWDGECLWVADTGNRRVLMWQGMPARHGQPADLVLGQRDFATRDENGGGAPGAASLRWPHGIALWGERLCVSDAGNNRIMLWNVQPTRNNAPCDAALGQRDLQGVDHNQSRYWPDADSLNMPYGIAAAGDWLIAADTANSRLVAWHSEASRTGAAARALSGQPDFSAKGDNRWALPVRDSFCWPYAIAQRNGVVLISDSGNNRIVVAKLSGDLDA